METTVIYFKWLYLAKNIQFHTYFLFSFMLSYPLTPVAPCSTSGLCRNFGGSWFLWGKRAKVRTVLGIYIYFLLLLKNLFLELTSWRFKYPGIMCHGFTTSLTHKYIQNQRCNSHRFNSRLRLITNYTSISDQPDLFTIQKCELVRGQEWAWLSSCHCYYCC